MTRQDSARGRYPSLDGLRGVAISGVVWHHANTLAVPGPEGTLGARGVDLFFAISGFLITTLLLREREVRGTVALSAFYTRRALRIFPLYYLVLLAYVTHALFLREHGPVRDHFLRSLPAHATFTTNLFVDLGVAHGVVFGCAWSLTVEEQFYLVWPWLLRVRGLIVPVIFMMMLLIVRQAADWGLLPVSEGSLLERVAFTIATPIGLGSLLAIGVRAPRTSRALDAILGPRRAAPLALLLTGVAIGAQLPLLITHAAMAALVGACAARPDHGLSRLTDARWVRHVGVVSYGIYLLHGPIVGAVRRVVTPHALAFGLGFSLSVGFATVSYRIIEAPFLRLRERFRVVPIDRRS